MKEGMGRHRLRSGETVIPGQIVKCEKKELGGAIDKFEQLDPDPPPPQPRVGLIARPAKYGRWDVINPEGGRVNDVPLTKEEAEAIVGGTTTEEDAARPVTEAGEFRIVPGRRDQRAFDVVNLTTGETVGETLTREEAEATIEEAAAKGGGA